jgi:hypothetical protein
MCPAMSSAVFFCSTHDTYQWLSVSMSWRFTWQMRERQSSCKLYHSACLKRLAARLTHERSDLEAIIVLVEVEEEPASLVLE